MNKKEYKFIKIKKLSGSIGAIIENVKLNNELTDEIFDEIYDAFLEYQVIFFRDQKFSPESQKSFANKIGTPIIYPFVKGLENFPEITPILKKEIINPEKLLTVGCDLLILMLPGSFAEQVKKSLSKLNFTGKYIVFSDEVITLED